MSASVPVTVLVAAKNEEANIGKCLAALAPAERVVVLDSHSRDATATIARLHGAEVVSFDYAGGYPKKRQWALDTLSLDTEWVFLLDADEVVPAELWDEVRSALGSARPADAYLITKGFHFLGRRFRFGGFSFAAVLLFRRGRARFERLLEDDPNGLDMEVHERLIVEGTLDRLRTPLIHEDFKSLEAYLARHNRYSTWEARLRRRFLDSGAYGQESIRPRLFGNAQERRRFLKYLAVRAPFEPLLWFVYHYVLRLGFLEGRPGLLACRFRSEYIAQVRAKMYEMSLGDSPTARRAAGLMPAVRTPPA
jgi:glycosyltransferase involved in cell wall biosynthesis